MSNWKQFGRKRMVSVLHIPEIADLAAAVNRLADIWETSCSEGLGGGDKPRYKPGPLAKVETMNEASMAKELGIPKRTLGKYRRQGRFPGCWLKNGRRVCGRPTETLEAWRRGIT